jgi:ATP-dependent Lhr-like helicase
MYFAMDGDEQDFWRILKEEVDKDFNPLDLVYPKEVPGIDKYDQYLPKELLRKEFAYSVLDIQEMKRCVKQMADNYLV